MYFIDVGVFPFAWEMCRIKRHPFSFTLAVSFDVSVLEARLPDGVGNRAKTVLSIAFLGNLHKLNATNLPFI